MSIDHENASDGLFQRSATGPWLGAHMSIAGGVDQAIDRGQEVGCDVIQIFTKSSRQWAAKPYTQEEVDAFRKKQRESPIRTVIAHDSYLLNLGAPVESLRKKSVAAFIDELRRCEALGIPYLIAHPGAHVGSGEAEGIKTIARSLNEAHRATKGLAVRVALEITAGQGSTLGHRFEQIRQIMDATKESDRLRVCFDTQHAFAAGYDLRTDEGYDRTFEEFDETIGFDRLAAFHLNDSKKGLGCRVDRHEEIGKGQLGLDCFRRLMNDRRFWGRPMCLETPKSEDCHEDIEALTLLRGMVRT
jgi:deoxyribonuclease-4